MYSILVVGAGYLGTQIARDFKARKQRVFALTRSLKKAADFEREEIVPVIADLNKPETLKELPPAHFIVISVAPDKSDEENYRKIYLDGVSHFLKSRKAMPRPHLIVLISSTSVWKEREGGWVNEETPADSDTVKGKILIAAENMVLNSGFPSIVFRLSGIYGPGRNRLEKFRSGVWPQAGEVDGYMNMIHVEDAASAMLPLFKLSQEGQIYVGTDDTPVLKSEFCRWLCEKTGVASSVEFKRAPLEGKRCQNTRLKELKFQFRYPSFREGYAAFNRIEGES